MLRRKRSKRQNCKKLSFAGELRYNTFRVVLRSDAAEDYVRLDAAEIKGISVAVLYSRNANVALDRHCIVACDSILQRWKYDTTLDEFSTIHEDLAIANSLLLHAPSLDVVSARRTL